MFLIHVSSIQICVIMRIFLCNSLPEAALLYSYIWGLFVVVFNRLEITTPVDRALNINNYFEKKNREW